MATTTRKTGKNTVKTVVIPRPESTYDEVRHRPESLDELVTDYVDFKMLIWREIREIEAKLNTAFVNYEKTNGRLVSVAAKVHRLETKGKDE